MGLVNGGGKNTRTQQQGSYLWLWEKGANENGCKLNGSRQTFSLSSPNESRNRVAFVSNNQAVTCGLKKDPREGNTATSSSSVQSQANHHVLILDMGPVNFLDSVATNSLKKVKKSRQLQFWLNCIDSPHVPFLTCLFLLIKHISDTSKMFITDYENKIYLLVHSHGCKQTHAHSS